MYGARKILRENREIKTGDKQINGCSAKCGGGGASVIRGRRRGGGGLFLSRFIFLVLYYMSVLYVYYTQGRIQEFLKGGGGGRVLERKLGQITLGVNPPSYVILGGGGGRDGSVGSALDCEPMCCRCESSRG